MVDEVGRRKGAVLVLIDCDTKPPAAAPDDTATSGDTDAEIRPVAKPPRLNFALVCLWCNEANCEKRSCIESHDRSTWGVCDRCGGFFEDGVIDPCWCLNGVMEVFPEYAGHPR